MSNFKYTPNIEYIGEVKISLIDKNNRVISISRHNAGEAALFRYIAMSLCGQSVISSKPRKLDITKHRESGYDPQDSIVRGSNKISTRDTKFIDNDGWCAVLSFSANRSNLSDPQTAVDFVLLGGDDGSLEPYATVRNIPQSVIDQLVPGTTLYIEWTLSIQNADSQEDNE